MDDLLKGKLEDALSKAGLDKGLLSFVKIESEEEIEGVVNHFKGLTQKPTVDELLKQKEIQREIDRRISEAKKKWEQKVPEPTPPGADNLSEQLAALLEAKLNPLTQKLEGFEKEKAASAKMAAARKALLESKIPENLIDSKLKYFNTSAEIEVSDWVKEQEAEHENLVQSLIDGGSLSAPVNGGMSGGAITDVDAQAIADRQKV